MNNNWDFVKTFTAYISCSMCGDGIWESSLTIVEETLSERKQKEKKKTEVLLTTFNVYVSCSFPQPGQAADSRCPIKAQVDQDMLRYVLLC